MWSWNKIHGACLHCKRWLFHCVHTLKNENILSCKWALYPCSEQFIHIDTGTHSPINTWAGFTTSQIFLFRIFLVFLIEIRFYLIRVEIPWFFLKKNGSLARVRGALTAVRQKDLKDGEGWKQVLAHPPLASPAFPSALMELEWGYGTRRSKIKVWFGAYQKDCSYGCFMWL